MLMDTIIMPRLGLYRILTLTILFIFGKITGLESVKSSFLPPIYWNISNPIFHTSNTDHVMDVKIGDRVDLLCPRYPPDFPKELAEKHVIYQVTKEEYDACRINMLGSKMTRQILTCDQPFEKQFYTVTFREFTPIPKGLEFKRGRDYYYISTSSGTDDGLNNLSGGSCREYNMRLIFKVCCSSSSSVSEMEADQPRQTHRIRHQKHSKDVHVGTATDAPTKDITTAPLPQKTENSKNKYHHEVEISSNEVSPEAGAYFNMAAASSAQHSLLISLLLTIKLVLNLVLYLS